MEKEHIPKATEQHDQEPLSYPHRYRVEALPEVSGEATTTEFDQTPQAFIELTRQYREVTRALALDFTQVALKAFTTDHLVETSQERIAALNQAREQTEQAPLDITQLSPGFLITLMRPKWQEHLPKDDSPENQASWEAFTSEFPDSIQLHLEDLRELDSKLRELSANEQLRAIVLEHHQEELQTMRIASAYQGADYKLEALNNRAAAIHQLAGASNRALTPGERRRLEDLDRQQAAVLEERDHLITSDNLVERLGTELKQRINIRRRREFDRGLVLTDSMKQIIDEVVPSLALGQPALLVGETGGAKTALAEYIARTYLCNGSDRQGSEQAAEFISGNSDVNTYQAIGKTNLRNDHGTPVSEFTLGPVLRAMQDGKPLILDEINGMPAEFLKRLNKILQLKPGEVYVPQEDSGNSITVRPGFCIIATGNEKSRRYKGIDDLSVELLNRFEPNIIRVHYPDHNVVYGQPPIENAIIARAAMSDRDGNLSDGVTIGELERLVQAAHVTQQVFSGNFGQGFSDYSSTERIAEGRPGLDEAVLAPRTLVALLQKVRDSNGRISLDTALKRFVSGIKSENDRQQMVFILRSYRFLTDIAGDDDQP